MSPPVNVVQLFADAARRAPTTVAFIAPDGTRITFGALWQRVAEVAAALAAHGVRPGDRAVFLLPMSIDLYVAVLGTLAAGGVAVFVDPWVSLRAIATLAGASAPRAFFGTPRAQLLRWLNPALRAVPLTVVNGPRAARWLARRHLDDLRAAPLSAAVARGADDVALVTYTTGSSGRPKGVTRTHGILAAQHRVIREEFPARSGDVDFTTFPVFALSNLAAGVTTVIPPVNLRRVADADPARVLNAMRAGGVTTMSASPPLFDVLAAHSQSRAQPLPPVRRIVTGGAPVSDQQLERWRAVWPAAEIVVAFGSSEAEPVASMTAEQRAASREHATANRTPGGYCVGRPVAAIRALVVPITRAPLAAMDPQPAGSIGELLVAGDHVCRDYLGDSEATRLNKVRDGAGTVWHRMGDTGYFDNEGRFWLVGRVHSTIRRRGREIHPQLVEAAVIAGDARIRHAAAVGLGGADDPAGGAGPDERLVVVVESDAVAVAADVGTRVRDVLGEPPDQVVVTRRRLPVDPRHNSKIDYARLRHMLRSGALP